MPLLCSAAGAGGRSYCTEDEKTRGHGFKSTKRDRPARAQPVRPVGADRAPISDPPEGKDTPRLLWLMLAPRTQSLAGRLGVVSGVRPYQPTTLRFFWAAGPACTLQKSLPPAYHLPGAALGKLPVRFAHPLELPDLISNQAPGLQSINPIQSIFHLPPQNHTTITLPKLNLPNRPPSLLLSCIQPRLLDGAVSSQLTVCVELEISRVSCLFPGLSSTLFPLAKRTYFRKRRSEVFG